METVNINIGISSLRQGWPTQDGEGNPLSIADCISQGWREVTRVDSAPAGCYIIRQGVKDLDGRTAALTVISYDIQRGPEPTPEPAIYGDPTQEYIRMDLGLSSRRFDTPRDIITPKGNTQGATLEQCEEIGWRRLAETIQPPPGMQATVWAVEEIDSHDCKVVCTAWIDPVEEAEKAKQARIAAFMANTKLVTLAHLYRISLREYFGADAETNHAVTKEAVAQYFIGLQQAQTITAQQVADANFLQLAFDELVQAWGSDSTGVMSTWELPWEQIP